jgi:hypothetical protein
MKILLVGGHWVYEAKNRRYNIIVVYKPWADEEECGSRIGFRKRMAVFLPAPGGKDRVCG